MLHPIARVATVQQVAPATLHIQFDDGTVQVIDVTPVLHGPIYGALRDPALFAQVLVDPEVATLVWPNGADFDPAILHDWPAHVDGLRELAETWERLPSAAPTPVPAQR